MTPIHNILIVLIIFILGMVAGVKLERRLNREKAVSFDIQWEREHSTSHSEIFSL